MKLSQFNFHLPDELHAQYPTTYRDGSRLMVLHRQTGEIELRTFQDILDYFEAGDFLILNDTKVFPACFRGEKERTNALIEVFLRRELDHGAKLWDAMVDPARKIRVGNKIYFGEDNSIGAEVVDNNTSRGRTLRFLTDDSVDEYKSNLFKLGHMPLPSYIHRDWDNSKELDKMDNERYQSIFATKEGAVAAPASCLHFSDLIMKRMELKDIEWGFITSHIGLGLFKKIDVEDLSKHRMEAEEMEVTQEIVDKIEALHHQHKRICAVGVDVMRALETVAGTDGHMKAMRGWTNKFIAPPYEFTVANSMLANFYEPKSAQLILTAAFGGYEKVMHAYQVAVENEFRFGDYGDAMLIID